MKNLLNDFDIKKALKTISEESIYALLSAKDLDAQKIKAEIEAIKGKRKRQEALAVYIEGLEAEHVQFCYRALRIAYFFHQHQEVFVGLYAYLAQQPGGLLHNEISENFPMADQVIGLYLQHKQLVQAYFIISLFTQQSKRYHQWRNDYSDSDPVMDADAKENLKTALWQEVYKLRGSRYCEMQSFEHDGKFFLLFDFENLLAENREFREGKPIDRYIRPSLEVAYAFDKENRAVEVVAADAAIRRIIHNVCAKVFYDKQEIPNRPPHNEFYDLAHLYQLMTTEQPIVMEPPSGCNVSQVFVESLRLRRKQFPYFTKELNIQCSLKTLESGRDYSMEMPRIAKYEVWKNGFWEKAVVEADHATLVVT